MFCLKENDINHLYSQGIDMRKGVEGFCGIIRTYQYSPTNELYFLRIWSGYTNEYNK